MTNDRRRLDLDVLEREVVGLAGLARCWSSWEPEDRAAYRAEWDDLVDVLAGLVDAESGGRLTKDDARRLRSICATLLTHAATLEGLRLRVPARASLGRLAVDRIA